MQRYQKKTQSAARAERASRPAEGKAPPMDALRSMASLSSMERGARPVDLPGAIQSKMEAAFGADLSGVKLFESQAVADMGAHALAQGSHIAFAPGRLDLVSMHGQALLGHELSHVVSQARGEVRGSGLLEDHALESRADREGMMAATGQSIYADAGAGVAVADAAGGPVQAKFGDWFRRKPKPQEAPKAASIKNPEDEINSSTSWEGEILPAMNDGLQTANSMAENIDNASTLLNTIPSVNLDVDVPDELGATASILSGVNELDDLLHESGSGDEIDQLHNTAQAGGEIMSGALGFLGAEKTNSGLAIVRGATQAMNGGRHMYEEEGNRKAGMNVNRQLTKDAATRTSDEQKRQDAIMKKAASSVYWASTARYERGKADMINGITDAAVEAVGVATGDVGKAAAGAIGKGIKAGADYHADLHRKRGYEQQLNNMDARKAEEERLLQKAESNGRKPQNSHQRYRLQKRAKHNQNAITAKDVNATTNKAASMHMTIADVEELKQLSALPGEDGEYAKDKLMQLGIMRRSIDPKTQQVEYKLASDEEIASMLHSDIHGNATLKEQMEDVDAHLGDKDDIVGAQLEAQKASEGKTIGERFTSWRNNRKYKRAAKKERKQAQKDEKKKYKENRASYVENNRDKNKKGLSALWDKHKLKKQYDEENDPRKKARATYKRDRDNYIESKRDPDKKGLAAWREKRKLKKEFDKESELQPIDNALENSATAKLNKPWYKRIGNFVEDKWNSMRDKHSRARTSFYEAKQKKDENGKSKWDQLSGWNKFKLVAANPLAYLKSNTKKGKAASERRLQEREEDLKWRAERIAEQNAAAQQAAASGQPDVPAPAPAETPAAETPAPAAEEPAPAPAPEPAPAAEEPAPAPVATEHDPSKMSVAAKTDRFQTGNIKAPVTEDELAPWHKERLKAQRA